MEIKNSHVMITGANRGIGRTFARACADDKAHLHLVVRKEDPEIKNEMEQAGAASVTIWRADLSEPSSVASFISQTNGLPIDILFNNAGLFTGGQLEEQALAEIDTMLQVNVISLIHLTQAFLPGMLQRKRGKIINHSSILAIMNLPGASTYTASKAAVTAFTNSLKIELQGTGVSTLLLITPGIKTRMLDSIESYYSKYLKMPHQSMSPYKYAEMIKEAVLNDLSVLEPQGLTGVGLQVAKFLPEVFNWGLRAKFKRK